MPKSLVQFTNELSKLGIEVKRPNWLGFLSQNTIDPGLAQSLATNLGDEEPCLEVLVGPSGAGGWVRAMIATPLRVLWNTREGFYEEIAGVRSVPWQHIVSMQFTQSTEWNGTWEFGTSAGKQFYGFVAINDGPRFSRMSELVQRLVAEAQMSRPYIRPHAPLPPASPVPGQDLPAQLERLSALLSAGALTKEEFERAKAKLLS